MLKTDKDREEMKHDEELREVMEKHAKELQDLGTPNNQNKGCMIWTMCETVSTPFPNHNYLVLNAFDVSLHSISIPAIETKLKCKTKNE